MIPSTPMAIPSTMRSTTIEASAPLRRSGCPPPGGGRAISSGRANSPSRSGRSIRSIQPTALAEFNRLKDTSPSGLRRSRQRTVRIRWMASSITTYAATRTASASAIARPTARRSVCRSESQMNSALIASESTLRKRSFRCRIGAPRVAQRGGPGLLFVVVALGRRRDFRRRARHAVRAGKPPCQVDRPAARRAEGERLVLLLRFHARAAAWTAFHACLLKCGGVGFNKRDSRQPQVGRLTAWRYHFMTAAMAAERTRQRIVLVVDDDPDILQTLALCLSTEGYEVLMASNGQEALDVLRQQKPACILLDLMMP